MNKNKPENNVPRGLQNFIIKNAKIKWIYLHKKTEPDKYSEDGKYSLTVEYESQKNPISDFLNNFDVKKYTTVFGHKVEMGAYVSRQDKEGNYIYSFEAKTKPKIYDINGELELTQPVAWGATANIRIYVYETEKGSKKWLRGMLSAVRLLDFEYYEDFGGEYKNDESF